MEDLLAREHSSEHDVLNLVQQQDSPPQAVLDAFNHYRPLAEAVMFADYRNAERKEQSLWQAHQGGRTYFAKLLRDMRRNHADRPVETRVLAKAYLRFLKDSEQHFRNFLNHLAAAAGCDPFLLAVVRHVKGNGIGESQTIPIPAGSLQSAYDSCYRTLCYLGDLSRYRVEGELDTKPRPSYAHAFGYYELAATFRPSSGVAHHQQAVIALKLKDHLNAVYSLYRSITIDDPFPLALNNLSLEVEKTNTAWEKNELIQKGHDPDASKRILAGWFIRMHNICFKGENLPTQLEREVFTQLATVIKQRDLDRTLMRMILTGIAAQYMAGERYQSAPEKQEFHDSYVFYLRCNLRLFTTLLEVFLEDLRTSLLNMDDHDVELAVKLTTISRRVLPCLRVLSNWLMSMTGMITGLEGEPNLREVIPVFWASYARAVDLVAQAFPIWDLEDLPELTYLLEEDAGTLEFLPLTKDTPAKTRKTWYNKATGVLKSRVSDGDVVRFSVEDEMLQRIRDFLSDGVNLANDDDGSQVPVRLIGTRVVYGDESSIEPLVIRPTQSQPIPIAAPQGAVQEKPKPVSYASIAAAHAQPQARAAPPPAKKPKTTKTQSRDAQLSRMVDDLVDDDEANNPATPPQHLASNPAVVSNGEVPYGLEDGVHDLSIGAPKYAHQPHAPPMGMNGRLNVTLTPPADRPAGNMNHERLHSLSKIWDSPEPSSSFFPSGLPTLGSPPIGTLGHSRNPSASSVRSSGPDPWDPAPRVLADSSMTYGGPLLFGAGAGTWRNPLYKRNASPPNGHG